MTLYANTCHKNEYKSTDNHNTRYISRVINIQIIHLNQHQSNEKTMIQLWASITTLQMAKMTTSVLKSECPETQSWQGRVL